jgi:hypothetical protein
MFPKHTKAPVLDVLQVLYDVVQRMIEMYLLVILAPVVWSVLNRTSMMYGA